MAFPLLFPWGSSLPFRVSRSFLGVMSPTSNYLSFLSSSALGVCSPVSCRELAVTSLMLLQTIVPSFFGSSQVWTLTCYNLSSAVCMSGQALSLSDMLCVFLVGAAYNSILKIGTKSVRFVKCARPGLLFCCKSVSVLASHILIWDPVHWESCFSLFKEFILIWRKYFDFILFVLLFCVVSFHLYLVCLWVPQDGLQRTNKQIKQDEMK